MSHITKPTTKTGGWDLVRGSDGGIPRQDGLEKQSPRRLAYLDGIRGVGAVLVYILHYQNCSHSWDEREIMESAYGFQGKHHFLALPFVRLLFVGGHHAVTTFFVLSGYACSYGCLRCIHAGDKEKLLNKLTSAVFRRWFRLWIPTVATTFLYMLTWHLFDLKTVQETKDTLREEIWSWYETTTTGSFVYTINYFNTYNFHTWTIPIEYRGSMVVYCALLVLHGMNSKRRLLCEAVLIWYFTFLCDGWYCAMFLSGMLLCDLDLLAETHDSPKFLRCLKPWQSWINPMLLMIAIYCGGVPCHRNGIAYLRAQPGWYWLSFLKPSAMIDPRWFFRGIAAVLTVYTVPRIAVVRAFFESRFCQYLGKVSFGFYLVHGPVLYTLGDRLFAASGRIAEHHARLMPQWINILPLSSSGPIGLEINFLAPHLIIFPFTLRIADLVTRLIDEPGVEFCHWLQRRVLEEPAVEEKVSPEQCV